MCFVSLGWGVTWCLRKNGWRPRGSQAEEIKRGQAEKARQKAQEGSLSCAGLCMIPKSCNIAWRIRPLYMIYIYIYFGKGHSLRMMINPLSMNYLFCMISHAHCMMNSASLNDSCHMFYDTAWLLRLPSKIGPFFCMMIRIFCGDELLICMMNY